MRFERTVIEVFGMPVGFVKLPGTVFFMGSNLNTSDRWPRVRVSVDSFLMSEYVVTQALFETVMGFNRSHFKGERLPVTNVSFQDAAGFCERISEALPGHHFRLPTEAEWERAATAGGRHRFAGSDNPGEVAWHLGNSRAELQPVGLKKPNAVGLYDMSGNVWEWCQDGYRNKYANRPWPLTPLLHDPRGKRKDFNNRIVRGGCFLVHADLCDIRTRSRRPQLGQCSYVGFRLVMDVRASSVGNR